MKILERRVYRGPSLYAHFPVMRLTLDLGELENWPSAKIPSFIDGLLQVLPALHEHGCSYGEEGGFVRRLREGEGTWMGHILEHVAIELQQQAGAKATFGKTRGTGNTGEYFVVFAYDEERVGEAAGDLALKLLHHLLPPELQPESEIDSKFQFHEELDELIAYAQRRQLGPSTYALVRAAENRDIPWLRMNDHSLVQFGHGKYQKRIQATVTSETRHIGVCIASDKDEANAILSAQGLPMPKQRLCRSQEGALRAAERLEYPVVIKPLDSNHGRGVSINLQNPKAVSAGFEKAREHSRSVIVETFIEGFDHRMLVVNNELIAVAKRVPGHVKGNGRDSVSILVDQLNEDPRRGIGHEKVLTRIEIDYQAKRLMGQKGYTSDSILADGEVLYLRSTGNLSTGGTATDMTDNVHPDNREMAVRAAQAIGLDVAGIDFITKDISKSYKTDGGAICEVNAAPGFRMHVAPTEGESRDVAGPVMDMLFPPSSPSRIPIATITGTNGKTTTARMLAHIQKMSGYKVGLTTTDGVYVDGERTVAGDMTGPTAAQMVLKDPSVDMAVLETARGGLLRAGLGYSSCNVAAVLNVAADHLGQKGIHSLDDLAAVKRIPIEVARDCAVLNADDLRCLKMADHTRAKRIAYVTMNPRHHLVKEHIQSGGLAAVLEQGINGDMITLYDAGHHIPLLWTHLIPATIEGKALHNVQNAMCAVMMAYALGEKVDNIRQGLRTFDTTYFQAPGRMNIFDELPFKVVLDYGHNPAAIQTMIDFIQRLDVPGRRICVLAAPGDRRDEDIREIAAIAAGGVDALVLRRDDHPRGRDLDEVPNLLRNSALQAGFDETHIHVVPEEEKAVEVALNLAEKGDLLLIFGDQVARCWKQITRFQQKSSEEQEVGALVGQHNSGQKPEAFYTTEADGPHAALKLDGAEVSSTHINDSWVHDLRGVRLAREVED